MRSFKKLACAAAIAAAGSLSAVSANAAIVVEDWQIDLTSVGGLLVTGVDAMGFNDAPVSAVSTDGGATYTVSGFGSISSLLSNQTGSLATGCQLDVTCELTFAFELQVANTGALPGGGFTFTHLAGDDVLRIWLDNTGNSTPSTGAGYTDGTLVATFDVQAGGGGSVSGLTLDGSDDATFILSALNSPTIIRDVNGDPMQIGETLAITDSNFDLDADNDGFINTQNGGFNCAGTLTSFCAQEDGTIRLAQVPEPGTLALLGGALLGLAGLRRKH